MADKRGFKIGVVAPGSPIVRDVERKTLQLVSEEFPDNRVEVVFHPQCFACAGHFAGRDDARMQAFVDIANDKTFHAVWFARGGYGACRITEPALSKLNNAASEKKYLGYSDAGFILAALYRRGFKRLAHGPMPYDILRPDGKTAVMRALSFLASPSPNALEPTVSETSLTAAFNISVLSYLLNTPFQPDLDDHVLMLEEVSETAANIDMSLYSIANNAKIRRVAGVKLGRCVIDSSSEKNHDPIQGGNFEEPEFHASGEEMVEYWCGAAGVPYLGRADIGHDIRNKIVPFGGRSGWL